MKTRWLFLFLSAFFFLSCEKWKEDELEFYWWQTGCADPWGTVDTDPHLETKAALAEYLENAGVEVEAVYFEHTHPPAVCYACHCATGLIIWVRVGESGRQKMIDLGFREE